MERFGGWIRYFLWNRGHTEAFQLKYEVIKRQMDIDRQFKEQLKSSKQKRPETNLKEKIGNHVKGFSHSQTIMQKHSERPVECANCSKFYLESQNTSIICEYHPKPFILSCPKTCSNPGLTALCAAHRMRRCFCLLSIIVIIFFIISHILDGLVVTQ
jgi:hypothetical protein